MTAPARSNMAKAAPATTSRALSTYVTVVVIFGAAMLVQAALGLRHIPHPWQWLIFGGCAILTGSFTINITSVQASISVADTFMIATALLFGPGPAAIVMAIDTGLLSWRKKHSWDRVAFNTVAPALSIWVAARLFFFLSRVQPLAEGQTAPALVIVPLFCLTVVYFLLNSGLTVVAVGLEARRSAFAIWREHFLWLSIGYLGAASIAFCFILLSQQLSPMAIVIVLPILAVFHLTLKSSFGRVEDAQRHLGDLDRLYLSTIETLAMAIDAKDDVTHSHVRRVQAYAVGLAQALGVDDELSIKAIKAAALLHDTGKLAVPEHILNKPGKLTASEFETMKLHVDVGADILSLVEFPYPVVPIVRCHHENWDGSGYPRGVKGEDIPMGARILSVVDCFDALTSDRPYRRAMTEDAAFAILKERSGTMYDPRVVDTFHAVYATIEIESMDTAEHRDVLRRISTTRAEPPAPAEPPTAATSSAGASNDVLAFVSLARIASGEAGTADVLALSSNLLADLIPGTTGAWYLMDSSRLQLTVADAFGPAAHLLCGTNVRVGERLSGWVAASRQPVVNSDAALDLESRAEQATPALRTCTSVPLLMGETLVGVLTLYSSSADAFDENRGRLLQMIAPHIAGAVHAASKDASRSADRTAAANRELRLVSAR